MSAEYKREWYKKNKDRLSEKIAERNRDNYIKYKEKILSLPIEDRMAIKRKTLAIKAKYRANNREKLREKSAEYRAKNLEDTRRRVNEWRVNNPHKHTAKENKRRAVINGCMPKWADKEKIEDIYKMSAEISLNTGIPHHVDHIVPIISEFVCGLHWEGNLQIVPASYNLSKGNKFIVGDNP